MRGERPPVVTLHEAADRLGVHYMTAYRYVRTGRLAARNLEGRWEVKTADVDQLLSAPRARPARRGRPQWGTARTRLTATLLAGDEPGAWRLVEAALGGGAEPVDLYLEVLAPTLRTIGDRWEQGSIDIADEHRASVVATRLVARLGPRFRRRGRRSGTVVVCGVQGDQHALPAALLSDVLRGEGFDVVDLGPNTPLESLLATIRTVDRVLAVCVSVSIDEALPAVQRVTRALHALDPGLAVLVGGPAIANEHAADGLDADGWAGDGRDAAATIRALARPGRSRA